MTEVSCRPGASDLIRACIAECRGQGCYVLFRQALDDRGAATPRDLR